MQNITKGWNDLLPGSVVFPLETEGEKSLEIHQENRIYTEGSFYTQSVAHWRTEKPVYNTEHCINCYQCWVYCPDSSILVRDEKMKGVDYQHCKGCGICSNVCPTNPKSLIMFQDFVTTQEAITQWPIKEKKSKE
ncbi:pyruvate ferredoxin oxidoreductase [Helicobacter didelphidarum]|uniref:Pyruvate ferredoxin oxidoreductase n=1 Tax=Helicobacter didelphidarum TaxID=2040648 RepID=A0A3D8IL21_9HELI|nr:4Fe-4S dicluster-binding protein [Helicobacter didelphidarum]RDU65324.1 pyruvate ferredoxin oxidoreductase [Helicobacter didelphidarum]